MSKLTFLIHEPDQSEPRRVPVESGLTLGRHPQCGCVLRDGAVSGRHARVLDLGGALHLEDLGGTNPVRVGGVPLQKGAPVRIGHGTSLLIGQTRIDVVAEAPAGGSQTLVAGPAATAVVGPPGGEQATIVSGGQSTVVGGAPLAPAASHPSATTPPATLEHRPNRPSPPPDSTAIGATARTPAPPQETLQADPMPASPPPAPGSGALGGGDQTMGTLVYGGQSFDPNDPHQVLALAASLRKARPRLVFANEADRRIVDIDKATCVIGRSKSCDCVVTHPGVSSEHARILYDGGRNRFTVDDAGGRNKTYLNNELLTANAPRDLAPEAHLRFGPIEALFVVDTDWEGMAISPEKYRAATEVLVRENAVQPNQRAQAEARAAEQNRHVGEILLLQEVVTIRQWQRAFQQGEVLLLTKRPAVALDDKRKLYAVTAVAALLLIVILVLLLR